MSDLARFWPAWPGDDLRRRLEAAYGDEARGYHDLRHLREVLHHVDDLLDAHDPAREVVLLAAWFHDAVYEGRDDDEERSARLAEETLPDPAVAAEVGRLVRLTRTHRPSPEDRPGQVLCDADLAILAADPDRYATYVRGVRAEHAEVADAGFAAGRAAVLRDLLSKPSLYHCASARARWELTARANIEREIRSLTSP
jgi:predicted metal-dependent HD superfamily phosphohydrolase